MNDDERVLLQASVLRFTARWVTPNLAELDHYPDRPLPEGFVEALRELGLLDLASSASADFELLTTALQALAHAAAAPAALVLADALGRYLLGEASAPISGLCAYPLYAEPDAPGLRLEERGGELRVDGTCQLVAGAPLAETLVLPAAGPAGTALVALDPHTAGVEIGHPLLTLGMRGCPTADVTLSAVSVPAARVVREADDLLAGAHALFRAPALAISTGVLARSTQNATNYARQRYQGGRNIIDHQEVRRLLAGMLADEQLCQSAQEQLLGNPPDPAATGLFVEARRRAARATCDGVQLLGGYGYMEDYGQERCMRDAKQAESLLGRSELLQQDAMAHWIAAGAAV